MSKRGIKRHLSDFSQTDNDDSYQPPTKQILATNDNKSTINKIQVYVRVRPENDKESNSSRVVEVIDDKALIFDPKEEDCYLYRGIKYHEIGKKANKDISFKFASVFDENASNYDVYEVAVSSFIPSLIDGFNCTIFAYGATGSGKTHTMLGSNNDEGVIYFTVKEIFKSIGSTNDSFEVMVSFFEVYNEKVIDLLSTDNHKYLKVYDDEKGGVNIANLTIKEVTDADEIIDYLIKGNLNRAQQATDANASSSRSHAVFQLSLRKKKSSNGKQIVKSDSKMCLVDLAGSERASVAYKENRSKDLQREGGNINKSLLALGNCINALATQSRDVSKGRRVKSYVPYRSSVLTRILADSLGGNCKTAMIATISPSSNSYDDTHNTLIYANRTQGINLSVRRRSVAIGVPPKYQSLVLESLSNQVTKLAEKVILLEAENAKLKKKPINPISSDMDSIDLLNSQKNLLDKLFSERLKLRKQYLECESNLKLIELKFLFRKLDNDRIRALGISEEMERSEQMNDQINRLPPLNHQKCYYEEQRTKLLKLVRDNEANINDIQLQIRSQINEDDFFVNAFFETKHVNAELQDKIISDKHQANICNELWSRFKAEDEILIESMSICTQLRKVLSGMNLLSDEWRDKVNILQRKLMRKKNVSWRDTQQFKLSSVERYDIDDLCTLPVYRSLPRTPQSKERGLETICAGKTPTLSSYTEQMCFSH